MARPKINTDQISGNQIAVFTAVMQELGFTERANYLLNHQRDPNDPNSTDWKETDAPLTELTRAKTVDFVNTLKTRENDKYINELSEAINQAFDKALTVAPSVAVAPQGTGTGRGA